MAFKALEDAIEVLKKRLGMVEKRLVPAGVVNQFAGATGSVPSGWFLCDGSAVSRTDYAELFAVIGTTYGTGNGTTTFNLPNLRGRVPTGLDVSQTEFNTLGKTGGAKTHTLTTAQIPAHTHIFANVNAHAWSWGGAGGTNIHAQNAIAAAGAPPSNNLTTLQGSFNQTANDGGTGGSHPILQPYITLNFIIKA